MRNQPGLYFDMWALTDQNDFESDYFGDALKFAAAKMQSRDKINKEILLDLKKNYFDKKKFLFLSIHHQKKLYQLLEDLEFIK